MKKKPILIIPILILIGGLVWYFKFRPVVDPNEIKVAGNIEVTDADLSFKIAGRLLSCAVDEGDTISKNQQLAQLEDSDQKASLELALAGLKKSHAVLAELEAGSRPEEIALARAKVAQARQALLELTRGSRKQEIKRAAAALDTALAAENSAQAQLVRAKADAERFARLYAEKTASKRDLEHYQTQYDVALNAAKEAASGVESARQALSLQKEGPRAEQIERGRAALSQAQAEYDLVEQGPRREKIEQAAAMVEEAKVRLAQAQLMLDYTQLAAPMDGVVLSRSAEPGEFLNPGTPVISVGDLAHPWVRAYITEKDLGRIKLGDAVEVSTDSFPGKTYKGTISYISSQAEFTPKSVQTFEERVKLMFRIKIKLANPKGELKPGMPATAIIRVP